MALIDTPVGAIGELQKERTLRSKTFDMGGGKRRLIQKAGGVVHYDDGGLKDIDTTIIQQGNDFIVDKTPFQLSVPDGVVGFDYTSRQGGTVSLRLVQINDLPAGPLNLNPVLNGNELWITIGPNLDFYIKVRPGQVQIWKVVKNPGAPHNWVWEITENNTGNFSIQTDLKAWDNQSDLPNTGGRVDEVSLRRKAVVETVITGKNPDGVPYTIREELTDETIRRDPDSRVKATRKGETVYPVLIDQDITENIVANADDGHQLSGYDNWYPSENLVKVGNSYSNNYHGGFRFQSVAVPTGATIDLANLILDVREFYAGTPRITAEIYSDAVADAAVWSGTDMPDGITKSTAKTTFNPTTTGDKTLDVTAQIQEIMDASFVLNNDMRLAVLNQNSGSDDRETRIYDYNQGSSNAAQLQIDYTVGGAEVSAPPIGSLALTGVGM